MQERTILQLFRRVWAFISRISLCSRSQIPPCLASCYLGDRSQSDVKLSHNLFKLISFVIYFKSAETRNSASLLCLRFTSRLKGKFRLTQFFPSSSSSSSLRSSLPQFFQFFDPVLHQFFQFFQFFSVSPDGQSILYPTFSTKTGLWMLEGFEQP